MPLAFAPFSLWLELPVLNGTIGRGSLARNLCQDPDELPTATLGLVPRAGGASLAWSQPSCTHSATGPGGLADQAALLRAMLASKPRFRVPPGTPTLVVASGKGGVGKSVIAVLLAADMARAGYRVLLLDGTQNLGNLHVLLGLPAGEGLERILAGECQPPELLRPVAERLWLLPAESGGEGLHGLGATDRARLHHRLCGLFRHFDLVVIDAPAGIEGAVRAATMRSTRLLVVTGPEPTALTDAYALIKIVAHEAPALPVAVLVNRVTGDPEGRQAFTKLATAADHFLGQALQFLGAIPEDPELQLAVRTAGHLLRLRTDAPSAAAIHQAAMRLELTVPAAA